MAGGWPKLTEAPWWGAEGTGLVAALTIDDGPNGDDTEAMLDLLSERRIRAVFCVIAEQIEAPGGASLLRRIVADGHVLANHSTNAEDLGQALPGEVEARMRQTLSVIRTALGDPAADVPFWRPPNGSWGCTAEVAVRLGMQPLAVVNAIGDWLTQDVLTLTERLRDAIRPGELFLVHDGGGDRAGTVAALRTVLDERLTAGWTFTLPAPEPGSGKSGFVAIDTKYRVQ